MEQKLRELLKKLWKFILYRPIFCFAMAIAFLLGIIFISLGSIGLLVKLLAKRPLFYLGIYFVLIIGALSSYYLYSKTRTKTISNATFNHFLRDVSSMIKTVIVLSLSFWLTTSTVSKIISVYFNRYDSRYQMGGSGNIFNMYPGLYPTVPEVPKSETAKKEPVKNEAASTEKIISPPDHTKKKTILTIPNIYLSQEYPSSQEYSYTQSINLTSGILAVMTLEKEEQPMWFGVGNSGLSNIGNPTLFLSFDGTFDIRVKSNKSLGWMTTDPNKQFNTKINMTIQPGSGVRLYPLFVKFPRAGKYQGKYTIAIDNNLPVSGSFVINVVDH